MKRENYKSVYLRTAGLTIALAIPAASFAQKHQAQPPPAPHAEVSRPQPNPVQPRGHAGDWLRRTQMSARGAGQRVAKRSRIPPLARRAAAKAARAPPAFFHPLLPSSNCAFSIAWKPGSTSLRPEAGSTTTLRPIACPTSRSQAGGHDSDRRPPRDDPEQREQVINSDRYKGMFSDQERDLMRTQRVCHCLRQAAKADRRSSALIP